jgi:hypothetical protein
LDGSILSLALDNCRRAHLTGARGWWWALGRFSALDLGATRARARRALTLGFVALAAVQNCWHWLRNRALQYIVAQIWNWRAFRLEHILAQIRLRRARGDGGF